MADESQEKTEEPTGRRQNKARSEGMVVKSEEVNNAFFLTMAIMLFVMMGSLLFTKFRLYIADSLGDLNYDLTDSTVVSLYKTHTWRFLSMVLPFGIMAMVSAVISSIVQHGWLFSTKLLKLNWKLLDFGALTKNIVSIDALQKLLKSLVKIVVLFFITYMTMKKDILGFMNLVDVPVEETFRFIARMTMKLLTNLLYIYLVIALADFAYAQYKHKKDLKMSKSEVKDEYRQMEGDPQVRSKIRSLMLEESRKRMMAEVPNADVVITNPVHLAVALRYDPDANNAPLVIAKGKRLIAQRIKEIARENDIPIVENPPLARAIYKSVEIGREIGSDLFNAVAEILAYVYQLKNRKTA
jgi:flagellar biosynthetic protein FlhB